MVSTPATGHSKSVRTVKTTIIRASAGKLSGEALEACCAVLEKGGLAVIPTDTVYGLACNAFNLDAIQRIYALKGRNYSKALPVLIPGRDLLNLVAREIPPEAAALMDQFWPGALTLVFKTAPMALHAARGKSTIAVRIPDHGIARDLLEAARVPLVATSANSSGKPSLTTGAAVRKAFEGKVELIVDAGECRHARESTVVDASHYPFTVLRNGVLSKERLAAVLGL